MANYPLVYYWVAEYTNGSRLAQFDEEGNEHAFREVNHRQLKRFGWHPFTVDLSWKIFDATKLTTFPTENPSHTLAIGPRRTLVAYRRNFIRWMTTTTDPPFEIHYALGFRPNHWWWLPHPLHSLLRHFPFNRLVPPTRGNTYVKYIREDGTLA